MFGVDLLVLIIGIAVVGILLVAGLVTATRRKAPPSAGTDVIRARKPPSKPLKIKTKTAAFKA